MTPLVLLDQGEDGYCEELGWVEATVTEDRARDMLAEFCADENGHDPYRPVGAARRDLRLRNPAAHVEDQRWIPCRPDAKTGREFWQVGIY